MGEGNVVNGRENGEDYSKSLQDLIEQAAPVFARQLEDLPQGLREWVSAGILIIKTIDEIERNPRIHRDFKDRLTRSVSELGNGDDKVVENLGAFLCGVGPTKPRYGTLLENIPSVLHGALRGFPVNVHNIIKRYAVEIAAGLSDEKDIETLDEHYRYCHYVGGSVGFMIADLIGIKGYLTQEKIMKIKPGYNLESKINPARDFGIALQLIDDIRNLHEDAAVGIQRWPSELLQREGISYEEIVQLNAGEKDKLARAYKILHEQIMGARGYIRGAFDCIEVLPYEPEGLRICLGNTLAGAAALSRIMNTGEFFYNEERRMINPEEITDIDRVVRAQTSSRMKLAPFVEHLFKEKG